MALKTVAVSDISSKELSDDTHARIVVRHPDHSAAIELDVHTDEAAKLVDTNLRLVTFTIYAPNQPPRDATVESKVLDKLFGANVDFDAVVATGRKVESKPASDAPKTRKARGTGGPKGDKRDYTSVEWAGSVKRGKISPGEKETVKNHLDEVNKHLAARGERLIDPKNPEHKEKYGL